MVKQRSYRKVPIASPSLERTNPRLYARSQLLTTIESVAPAVLAALHHGPYDLYRGLPAAATEEGILSWDSVERSEDHDMANLRASLLDWGTRWNLDADWVYSAALRAMDDWTDGVSVSSWGHSHVIIGPTVQPVAFELKNWRIVAGETRHDFERRARKAFGKWLTQHRARIERTFLAGPRERRYDTHPDRFKWTVRWAVCREPVSKIAKDHPHLRGVSSAGSDPRHIAISIRRTIDRVLRQAAFRPDVAGRGKRRMPSSTSGCS